MIDRWVRGSGLSAALLGLIMLGAMTTLAAPPTTSDPAGNMALGFPSAKITVTEYASVGCPHCARWAKTVFPAFKVRYVDTRRVRFVFHEMLTGDGALAAAGFLTARCAGPRRYFQVVNEVFDRQTEIAGRGAPVLAAIAQRAGLSAQEFNACLNDEIALKTLDERTEADARAHGVSGTPTFFVNDTRLDGEQTLAALETAIAHARR